MWWITKIGLDASRQIDRVEIRRGSLGPDGATWVQGPFVVPLQTLMEEWGTTGVRAAFEFESGAEAGAAIFIRPDANGVWRIGQIEESDAGRTLMDLPRL
jgi:hypothetical protein